MTWIPLLIRPKWWHGRRVSRDCITSIEGSLISAEALFCLRALFDATRIHSRLGDLYATRRGHFQRGNLLVHLYPRMDTFLLVPRQASNHRRNISWGVNIDYCTAVEPTRQPTIVVIFLEALQDSSVYTLFNVQNHVYLRFCTVSSLMSRIMST